MSADEPQGRPTFSVVMPCYNASATLERSVGSVLGQTLADHELIVIDDGSSDDGATERALRRITDPRLRWVRQANAGVSAARNAGAQLARGEFLTFLDGDDEAAPDWLEAFAGVLHPDEAPLARCAARVRRGAEETLREAQPFERGRVCPRGTHLAGSFALTRELFTRVGGYDPSLRFAENTELLLRLALRWRDEGWRVGLVERALVTIHQGSGRAARYGSEPRRSAELLLARYGSELADDRELLSDYAAIIGTDELRHGRRLGAARWLLRSLRARPSARGALRLARCALPRFLVAATGAAERRAAVPGSRGAAPAEAAWPPRTSASS